MIYNQLIYIILLYPWMTMWLNLFQNILSLNQLWTIWVLWLLKRKGFLIWSFVGFEVSLGALEHNLAQRNLSSFFIGEAPVTTAADDSPAYFFIVFQRKLDLIFHVNPLLGRRFTWNIKQQMTVLNILSLFFRENKTWYFMWILCWAEDSHETSSLIFFER